LIVVNIECFERKVAHGPRRFQKKSGLKNPVSGPAS